MRTSCIQCQAVLAPDTRVCPACRTLQPSGEKRIIAPGSTFDLGYGRVVFDARVGEGGMGVVWRGWLFHAPGGPRAHEPPEAIALKVLRPQAQVKAELRALFVNEAATLRRLSHPNIVRYYDLFEWNAVEAQAVDTSGDRISIPAQSVHERERPREHASSPLVLAIEYVVGDTLEDVIARHVARARLAGTGALPGMAFRRAWYYFEQLLGALAATHAISVVHRDIKPSNILIRHDGIVKLTDFGIARLATDALNASGAAALNQTTGLAAGTSAYMSPEQVLSKPLDGRSDLYSAGIVLYEMLSGNSPFSNPDDTEFLVRRKQVEMPVPSIRTWLAQAPPALDALFARALAKDPAYRFASAIEMGNAFRIALGLPETPEWQAQTAFAHEALSKTADETPRASQATEKRMETLREFVLKGYQTMKMAAR